MADAVDVVSVLEDSVDVVLSDDEEALLVEEIVSLDRDDEVVLREVVSLLEVDEDVVMLEDELEVLVKLLVLESVEELPVEEIVTTGHEVVVVRRSVNVLVANVVVV